MKTLSRICLLVLAALMLSPAYAKPQHRATAKKTTGLTAQQRTAASEALRELRKLGVATEVGINYKDYGARLIDAIVIIEEKVGVLPTGVVKNDIMSCLETHRDANFVWGKSYELDFVGAYINAVRPIFNKYKVFGVFKQAGYNPPEKDSSVMFSENPDFRKPFVDLPLSAIWKQSATRLNKASSDLAAGKK